MRISTSFQYSFLQGEINLTSSALFNAQQAVTTGKRINQLSDDPGGATASIQMRTLLSQVQQYNDNLTQAKGFLGFTDTALGQVTNALNSAYQIAVSGADATNDDKARQALVTELNTIEGQVVNIANTTGPNGQYIFAGQKTDKAPFSATGGKLVYSGDTNNISVEVNPSDQMVINTPGSPLFTDIYSKLESLKTNLSAGNLTSISKDDIAAIKASLDQVAQLRGSVGAKVQSVTDATNNNNTRLVDLTKGISGVEDIDVAQAMVNLTQAQTAYQAALLTTGQANKFSLMDFIQ